MREIWVFVEYNNQLFLRVKKDMVKTCGKIRECRAADAEVPLESADDRLAQYIDVFLICPLYSREENMLLILDELGDQFGLSNTSAPVNNSAFISGVAVVLVKAL